MDIAYPQSRKTEFRALLLALALHLLAIAVILFWHTRPPVVTSYALEVSIVAMTVGGENVGAPSRAAASTPPTPPAPATASATQPPPPQHTESLQQIPATAPPPPAASAPTPTAQQPIPAAREQLPAEPIYLRPMVALRPSETYESSEATPLVSFSQNAPTRPITQERYVHHQMHHTQPNAGQGMQDAGDGTGSAGGMAVISIVQNRDGTVRYWDFIQRTGSDELDAALTRMITTTRLRPLPGGYDPVRPHIMKFSNAMIADAVHNEATFRIMFGLQ